jgi:hypothetical protein
MSLKCCWIDNMLDTFYVLICIIATPYSLASCLIRFSSLHTCFPFTSRRLCALPKVQHTRSKNAQLSSATTSFPWRRTNTCNNHGYNTVADDSRTGSHLLSWNRHSLVTKKVKKVEKVKTFGSIHTLRSLPDQGEDVCEAWFWLVQKCEFV